jgi:hypothetical protein
MNATVDLNTDASACLEFTSAVRAAVRRKQDDEDSGLAPGARFADIQEDWTCLLCGQARL